ncbi:MAG TPA: enoyl-CoA hydratase/isomerase family protein [Thermoleophilaceae bacterium]|nr:enoyl-CoA hydratase/isomerase family protein [Thermoleophilaceae bacterium]
MAFEKIRYEVDDAKVATITLDDPETRNALGNDTLAELIAAFEQAGADPSVGCVVLTSSHDKVFSAGGNLAGFAAEMPLVHKHFGTELFPRLFRTIGQLGKPTICAANGHVLAGSLGVALACDLIVASEKATFGTPEINVGVFPFMIMALIYRNIGRKKTNEMLLLGERLTAKEALEIGLVNKVAPPRGLELEVREWAEKLAAKSPLMMRLGKDAMYRQQDMAFDDALEFLHHNLTLSFSTEDIQEGVKAFFEKREPQWSGR